MTAATRQAAERRTAAPQMMSAILAARADPYQSLAAAVIGLAVADCRRGDASACSWVVTKGSRWLGLLMPSGADPEAVNGRLRAMAPDVVQLALLD